MALKRYFANKDNTITDSFQSNLTVRGTGSNMGRADILETFYIYAQQSSTSQEKARILVEFPISDITTDRTAGNIPDSGSVSFFLKMTNARHSETLPSDFTLSINAITGAWQEGRGLDMENYTDLTYDNTGSNWVRKSNSLSWDTTGGDFFTDISSSFDANFVVGDEDLEVDITTLVEQWVNSGGNVLGTKNNNGVIIKLSSSFESSTTDSYYTKKFFARSTEFFFRRPTLEARWDSSRRDNRGNMFFSSSILPGPENLMNLYMYNYYRGNLVDIVGETDQLPTMKLYYSSGSVPEGDPRYFRNSSNTAVNSLQASRVSKGIYRCTFSVTASAVAAAYPYLVDVWEYQSAEVHTGSTITIEKHDFSNHNPNPNYVISMPNLKKAYSSNETERFRLFVRRKGWSPNIYTVANATTPTLLIQSASYKVIRISDEKVVVPYNTGSDASTLLSYDAEGNYFDLDMSLFEPGYTFGFQYTFYEDSVGSYREQPHIFKFRMIEDEL